MLDQLRAKFAVHPVDIGLLHHLLWSDFICPGERVMTCQGQAQPLLEQRLDRQFEIRFRRIDPELAEIKQKLYNLGAVYAAMSGSGSAIFGIFKHKPANIEEQFEGMFCKIMKL